MANLVAYMAYQNSNLLIKQENKNSKKKEFKKMYLSIQLTGWMERRDSSKIGKAFGLAIQTQKKFNRMKKRMQ